MLLKVTTGNGTGQIADIHFGHQKPPVSAPCDRIVLADSLPKPGIRVDPKASKTILFLVKAEVYVAFPAKRPFEVEAPSREWNRKMGVSLPARKVYYQKVTFGRSFHYYPGMSPGSLFGATRHKLSEGKCPANST